MDYSINPYLGCGFGCRFCYAAFMAKFASRNPEEWGSFAYPKEGFIEALERELVRRSDRYRGKKILIGTVMDPYQPLESRYELTKKVLEVFRRLNPGAHLEILTRSSLVLRDVDLLKELDVRVGISLSIIRREHFREVEPKSPPLEIRIDTLSRLKESGVRVYGFVAPVFPDAPDVLENVLHRLSERGIEAPIFEFLSPGRNPALRNVAAYPRWVNLIRTPGTFDRFEKIIRRFFPHATIIRHGWR